MKERLQKRFHDVTTYVKLKCRRTLGECAIVIVGAMMMVLASVSTDSMNIESKVEMESLAETAKASTNLTKQEELKREQKTEKLVAREQTENAILAKKAVEENELARLKEIAFTEMKANEISIPEENATEEMKETDFVCRNDVSECVNEDLDKEELSEEVIDTEAEETQATEAEAEETEDLDETKKPEDVAGELTVTENQSISEDALAIVSENSLTALGAVVNESQTGEETILLEETVQLEEIPAQSTEVLSEIPEEETATEVVEEVIVVEEETATTVEETDTSNSNYNGISASDYDALCRIVQAEAGTEGEQGKMMVASVVINRVLSPSFPCTIEGVILQDDQFSPVSNGSYQSSCPDAETINAVNRVLGGENAAVGALYFKSVRSTSDWSSKTLLYAYGNHNFYY